MRMNKHESSMVRGFTCDLRHRPVVGKRRRIQTRGVWLLFLYPVAKPDTNAAEPLKAVTIRCADATSKIEARRTAKGRHYVQEYPDPNGRF